MSTTATSHPFAPSRPDSRVRLGFGGILHGEWIKLLSLRSTWWSSVLTVVLMGLFGLAQVASLSTLQEQSGATGDGAFSKLHGAEVISGGYQFGMVTVAVLGVLAITGEYSTGMIRSTLTTVPTRIPVLVAKALVLVVLTVLVSALGLIVSYLVSAPLLSPMGLVPALEDPATWQVFGGMAYFLAIIALFGLGVGTVLRHSAAGITAVLGVLLLLPMVLQYIALEWVQQLMVYLPVPAATAFLALNGRLSLAGDLTLWEGVAVVAGYAVVALGLGAVLLRRRDA